MASLSGYEYRKKGAVNATTAGVQTNYQLELVVGESSGASGEDVDCESLCQDFPNDIRFTKEDGETKHDYWVESITGSTPNRLATVVIEVASIPASGSVDFYMYYGKASDSGESNGDNTFDFFDDFTGVTIDAKYLTAWSKSGSNPLQTKTCQNWMIAVYSNYNSEDKIYIFEQRDAHPSNTIKAWSFTRANAATPAQWTDHGVVFTGVSAHDDGHIEPHGIIFETQTMADAREGVGAGLGTRKWRMYYCAKGAGEDESKYSANFAYAAESDLTSWTAYASNPVYDHDATYGYADSKVCIYDNKVWMHHCAYTDLTSCNPSFFSYSDDGLSSWMDTTRNWATERTVLGTLIPYNTGILLTGNPAAPDRYAGYFTTDGDDKASYSGNPILSLGAGGQWDDADLHWCTIVVDKEGSADLNAAGIYYMYYIGYDGATNKLGLATSTTETEESGTSIDNTKWNVGGSPAISSGKLLINAANEYVKSINTFQNKALKTNVKFPATAISYHYFGFQASSAAGSYNAEMFVSYLSPDLKASSGDSDGVESTSIYDSSYFGSYHNYELLWKSGEAKFLIDNVLKDTDSTEVCASAQPVGFFEYVGSGDLYVDWVFIRNYVSPEPTWGTWDNQQCLLQGAVSTTSSVSGALSCTKKIGGPVSSTASVAGSLTKSIAFAGAISALSAPRRHIMRRRSCLFHRQVRLFEVIPATLSMGWSLKGTITATSTISGTLSMAWSLKGDVSATSSAQAVASMHWSLKGAIAATSSVSGSIIEHTYLTGSLSATSTVSGSLSMARSLKGDVSVTSALQGMFSFYASKKGFYYAKIGSTIFRSLNKDSFRITEELNKIPSFEFEISNSADNRAAITAGITDIFRIYHRSDSTDTLMFTGIINGDAIEYLSMERIRIIGYASYIDLNWRFHQHLNSEDAENVGNCYVTDNSVYIDRTSQANNDTINDVRIPFTIVNDAIYIGRDETFFGMQVKYSTKGVQAANTTVIWEYSEGSSVWSTLDVLDETRQFTEDVGTYYVTIPHKPSDWAKETVNSVKKFWIRARLTAGSYTSKPKLDRIKIMNVDIYRVYYFETAANSIMNDVLAGTGYSMDVTDVCPSDTISIVAEYETKLRFIAGVANALTWDDGGDKKSYQWWIDTSNKVHFKQKRGATLGDITSELTILNNVQDYFNLSNRIILGGNYDGLNKLRAVIEDIASQDEHGIREHIVSMEQYNNYIPLKEAAQKAMTYTKAPLQKISATVSTRYWVRNSFEVGDTVTLHQDRWNVAETAFQIVRADIGPRVTNIDMGISQEHLDGLKAGFQRQLDISGIRMHGSTSLLQFGPETMNYQRVDDSTVFYSKLKFEIPSDARYIHKILISWKLGNYRADVSGGSESAGHDHTGYTGSSSAHDHTGVTGLDGAHTPTELSKAHEHTVTGSISWTEDGKWGRLATTGNYTEYENNHVHPNPNTGSEFSHTHTNPYTGYNSAHIHSVGSTGGPSSTTSVFNDVTWGTGCAIGACVQELHFTSVASSGHDHSNPNTGAGGGHDHSIGNTGTGSSHNHSMGNTGQQAGLGHRHQISNDTMYQRYMTSVAITADLWTSNEEDPAHIHIINPVVDHTNPITSQVGENLTVPTEPAGDVDLTLGIVEVAGGTVMQLTVNGEEVTTIDGNGTDVVITGYCNTGSNTVELSPIVGSNTKGGATLEGRGIIFIESSKF